MATTRGPRRARRRSSSGFQAEDQVFEASVTRSRRYENVQRRHDDVQVLGHALWQCDLPLPGWHARPVEGAVGVRHAHDLEAGIELAEDDGYASHALPFEQDEPAEFRADHHGDFD